LKTIPGTKNVGRSSLDTPGQFVFLLKRDVLSRLGITPNIIYSQLNQSLNGVKIASIEDSGNDVDIIIKTPQFQDSIDMNDILSLPIEIGPITYRAGEFIESQISNATANISRQDGKIEITVDADAEDVKQNVALQQKFLEFAKNYTYPPGVTYTA
jgi:multidrug efflux pump subunit AcrB